MRASRLPKKAAEIRVQAPTVDLDRWKNDFVGFAAQLETQTKAGALIRVAPTPLLAKFEAARTGRDIALKPRQVFMTTWELARDIWYFLTHPGANVVVICQSMSDDTAIKELSVRIGVMLGSLRSIGVHAVSSKSATEWVIPERRASLRIGGAGASEVAASKKFRGATIQRLHMTELAFFEFAQETLNAILESVPARETGSEITVESTANGASGAFFERWTAADRGETPYRAHFFCWLEHPEYRTPLAEGELIEPTTDRERELATKHGATAEQIKWYRAKVADKGQDLVDQEYPTDPSTCWLTSGRLFFDRERTKQLISLSRAPIATRHIVRDAGAGTLYIWASPKPGAAYVIAADPSEGVGGDPAAAVVYERGTGEHVATLHGQFPTRAFARVLAEIGREYNTAFIVVERINHGHAVLGGLIEEKKYPRIYEDAGDERPGWKNSEITRATALEKLHDAHHAKGWSSPDALSLGEMLRFIINDKGKAEAATGAHDDLVIAHAIAWDVLSMPVVDRRRHEILDYDESDAAE